jgi:V8-like Glu-specific endopeptidase
MMAWNKNLTNLNYVLADLYPRPDRAERIVRNAGLPLAFIRWQPSAIDTWFNILDEADKRGKVLDVIHAVMQDGYQDNPFLKQAEQGTLDASPAVGPVWGETLDWLSDEPADTFEKIMGAQSTLLPIGFLEVGLQRARSVARVRLVTRYRGEERVVYGSGFLSQDNLFVTNNHVIANEDEARAAIIEFDYELTARDLPKQPVPCHLDPDAGFATSHQDEDDWTVVRVQGDANANWDKIEMHRVTVSKNDRVNIIQHPMGEHKQIALYHNLVAYADEKRIQYLTDTMRGSSGSPVFDSQWRLVALHHSGGDISEPGTGRRVKRNEGINIQCVIDGLRRSGLMA